MTIADRHRQRLYDTELAALGGTHLDDLLSWIDLEATFHAVLAHPWWRGLGIVDPRLRPARADSRRSSADGSVVRIARDGRTGLTLAHELAHHLVHHLHRPARLEPAHGPTFRAALLRTVEVLGGPRARRLLADALSAAGLAPGTWVWAEPAVEVGLCIGTARAGAGPHQGPDRVRGAVAVPSS